MYRTLGVSLLFALLGGLGILSTGNSVYAEEGVKKLGASCRKSKECEHGLFCGDIGTTVNRKCYDTKSWGIYNSSSDSKLYAALIQSSTPQVGPWVLRWTTNPLTYDPIGEEGNRAHTRFILFFKSQGDLNRYAIPKNASTVLSALFGALEPDLITATNALLGGVSENQVNLTLEQRNILNDLKSKGVWHVERPRPASSTLKPPFIIASNDSSSRAAKWRDPTDFEQQCYREYMGLARNRYYSQKVRNNASMLCTDAFTQARVSDRISCIKQTALTSTGDAISKDKVLKCRNPSKVATETAQETKKYEVKIDCYFKGLDYTGTENRITVQFWSGKSRVKSIYMNGISQCGPTSSDPTFSISTQKTITDIVVKTDGRDAFFIDELRIIRDGVEVARHGRDQGRGWCISKDETDNTRSWKGKADTCKERKSFPAY